MINQINYPNGDAFCFKHGYQISGDNVCETCYVECAEENGPILMEKINKAIDLMEL